MEILTAILTALLKTGYIIPAIVIIIIGVGFYFINKYTDLFDIFRKKHINLLNHSVFCNIDAYNFDIVLQSNDSKKTKAVKRYVKCYVDHLKGWLISQIATDKEWNTQRIIESYQKMVNDVEYCWIQDQAPMIFIEKWRQYNKSSNDMVMKYIRQASESDFYELDLEKKILILTITQVIFFASLKDIDNIVYTLNGELDKIYND
jgi:hypothetical protein